MDTDNLTEMAFLANDATDTLTCELGALCGRFKTEDECLTGVLEYLADLAEAPEEYLDFWGLLDDADVTAFAGKIDKLRQHVETTIRTPYPERGAPPFA